MSVLVTSWLLGLLSKMVPRKKLDLLGRTNMPTPVTTGQSNSLLMKIVQLQAVFASKNLSWLLITFIVLRR